jgi:hypothetical protein
VNFTLNEEQTLLREAVERFASERYDLPRRAAYRATEAGFSTDNWTALADLGLLSLPFPAELGGLGGGTVELITVMEVLGRTLAVEPVLEAVVTAGGLLSRAGTPAQVDRWLPGIMSGEVHLALAHLESQARFDLEDVRTEARMSAGGSELHGEKSVVLSSEAADAFIVSARAAGNADPGDISFYIVAADARGSNVVASGSPTDRVPAAYGSVARRAKSSLEDSEILRQSSIPREWRRALKWSASCRCCWTRRSSTCATAVSLARRSAASRSYSIVSSICTSRSNCPVRSSIGQHSAPTTRTARAQSLA